MSECEKTESIMSYNMYRRINVVFIKMFSKLVNCVTKSIYTCVLKFPLKCRAGSRKPKT